MKKWSVTLMTSVEVEANTESEAIKEALRVDRYGWDDIEAYDAELVEDEVEKAKDCCTTCSHCVQKDPETQLISCDVDKVPNGHKNNHCCPFFDKKKEEQL